MASERIQRLRAFARRAAVLLSAGAVVAALNISGVGAPQPGFTALDERERHSPASRSLPDRLEIQPGVTVDDSSDPFLALETGEAELERPGDGSVCISSPLPPGVFRISSNYGMRTNPITGGQGLHAGVDLAAAFGTPIHAVADGTVSYTGAGRAGRSSELVIIDHEVDGVKFSSWYIHMYPDGVFVEAGQDVRAGEVIAEVGSNGFSTGPHLHLEIHTKPGVVAGKGNALGRILSLGVDPSDTSDDAAPTPTRSPTSTPSQSPSESPERSPSDEPPVEDGDEQPPNDEADDEEDTEGSEDEEPAPTPEDDNDESSGDAKEIDDIEIEVDDDGGKNDHTIGDTVSRSTGVFDPSSLGVLHDPLPFLRALGYGLASPSRCAGG